MNHARNQRLNQSDETGLSFSGSYESSILDSHPVCQICSHRSVQPGRRTYIGKICDLFSDCQAGQLPSQHANWAISDHGELARRLRIGDNCVESKACLVAENGVLCYWRRGGGEAEEYRHIRWAKGALQSYSSVVDRLVASGDTLPFPVVFSLCFNCTKLARNYVAHWNVNHPHDELYGFDAIYVALKRRLLSLSTHHSYPKAFYTDPKSRTAHLLGRAVVVQSTPAAGPFRLSDIPVWTGVYPFNQVPSLPRWLKSKLKLIETPGPEGQDGVNDSELSVVPETESALQVAQASRLCNLPLEILGLIKDSLDRQSLFALRLTSTYFACRLPLDQAFWYHEITQADSPLFGFEPLSTGEHTHIQAPGLFGRIDAFSELAAQYFKPQRRKMFDPVTSTYLAATPPRNDWRRYDWKGLVRMVARAREFEDGGACDDAPTSWRARRWLWGQIDQIFNGIRS